MDPANETRDILYLMSSLFKSVHSLYVEYGSIYPETKEVWLSLANDHLDYADWIANLNPEPFQAFASAHKDVANPAPLNYSVKYVSELHERTKINEIPLSYALSTSLWIEKAVIEQKVFQHINEEPAELKTTLTRLASSVRDHITTLQDTLNQYKAIL